MSDDSKELSRVEDILSGEDYLPKKPMSRVEELLMDGAMVPKVDDTDNGKVLKVIDGEWQPGEDVSGDNLPPVSSLDNGKVLKVVSGEWNIGDDKSESSFVYISSSYPFSGSKVALPANINSVLIANYTSSPKVPTFLVTSNNVIFEPKEVDISTGTTPSVHIRWGRMYSEFDSGTTEKNIYNDSLSYNTQNQTTEASYYKTKAIPTIPPVDSSDNNKVMQVSNGQWVANLLPEVAGVPAVEQADVGKVLKATAEGEYGWGDASKTNAVQVPPVIYDNGELKKMSVDKFPGLEKVYLTPTAYSNLSTAQKEDLSKIYYVSDYEFITNDDKTLVLRIDSSNNVLLFFNGVVTTNSTPLTMPSEIAAYISNYPDSYGYYDPSDTSSVDCYINCNWSGDNSKYWSQSGRHNGTVINDIPVYGVMNPSGVYGQELVYTNPWDIEGGFIIYYGNKQYTDFDIPDPLPEVSSSDNGKVLKVVNGAWAAGADEGGSEAVYKTLAEYEALSTADKEDPTKIYFVKDTGTTVSETKTQDDGTVTASAVDGTHYAWYVFDAQGNNRYWSPYNASFSGSWFKYEFANKYTFTGMDIWLSTWDPRLVRVVIEASNDNSTWTNITQNEYYDIETVRSGWNTTGTKYSFILNANTIFKYVRVTFSLSPASQTTQKETALYVQHCDIKAATDARPKIYYKNVLYTSDELPAASTSDAGKALVVNSDGLWDKSDIPSSCTPVEIEAEDYHALTTPQKEDQTKVYFVKAGQVITDPVSVIPRNPSSSNIDCNTGSASYNTSAIYAFDGVMNSPPNIRITDAYSVSAWYPGYGNAPASAWASYHFDYVTTNLVKLEVYAYNMATTDPSAIFTTPVIVEGSTDGTTWFNILADGASSFTFNTKETEFVKNVIPLDNTVSVSYIRFRFLNQINGYNEPNFAIAEIYAYTGNVVNYDDSTYYKGIKHGKTIQELPELLAADEGKVLKAVNGKWSKDDIYRELTQAEYDALPSSKDSDGIIYFITDNS